VRVATGWGTLRGGGETSTDENGNFTLRFAEGIWSRSEANLQAAVFLVSKPGYVEFSRSRPGAHHMARVAPDEAQRKSLGADPERTVLPGRPYRIDFVLSPPATLEVSAEGPAGAVDGVFIERADPDAGPGRDPIAAGSGRWEVVPGVSWRFARKYRETRFFTKSRPFTPPGPGVYRVTLKYTPDAAAGLDLLDFARVTGPDGAEVAASAFGDDPLAKAPVDDALQRRGREILRSMAEANAPWLGEPPAAALPYEFRFRFAGEDEGRRFTIDDPPPLGVARRGVSYFSVLHHLARRPDDATFRLVDEAGGRLRLAYTLREPIVVAAGNGVSGTWHGFFSRPFREGLLTLDATRFTPLESRSDGLVETFSQYAEVSPGRFAPLVVRVESGGMRFDWRFQVVEPGLWLLNSAYDADSSKPAAEVDGVKVRGAEARRVAVGAPPEAERGAR
jgi:hypothetical protein